MENKPNNQLNEIGALFEKAELPLLIAFFGGLIFKVMHWPGGSILLILAAGMLNIIYFMNLLPLPGKDTTLNSQEKFIHKLNGLGASIGVIAILFIIQRWPGGRVMVLVSAGALLAGLALLFMKKNKEGEAPVFGSKTIIRSLAILFLEALLYFGYPGPLNQ